MYLWHNKTFVDHKGEWGEGLELDIHFIIKHEKLNKYYIHYTYSLFHKTLPKSGFINALKFGKVLWNGRYLKNDFLSWLGYFGNIYAGGEGGSNWIEIESLGHLQGRPENQKWWFFPVLDPKDYDIYKGVKEDSLIHHFELDASPT